MKPVKTLVKSVRSGPMFLAAAAALWGVAPSSLAQHQRKSNHGGQTGTQPPSSHYEMAMGGSTQMGTRGMKALQGLSGKEFTAAFLSQMVAHHQGAIEMARQALKIAKHAETRKEAEKVIQAQRKENERMTSWLKQWYGGPSVAQMNLVKQDMKNMMDMGVTSDRMFFDMMIPHHETAVTMARLAAKRSDRAEVRQLAEKIAREQHEDIARLKRMLNQAQ